MKEQTNILSVKNLMVGYKSKKEDYVLLNDVNVQVAKGEFISLIGKNGIGKSTLLRTIVGLQNALSGEIQVDFLPISHYSIRELSKIICYVSTEHILIPNLTVYDFVSFARTPYTNWFGSLTKNDEKVIKESLELTNTNELKNRIYDELSDGEKQRVLIARALAQDTEIIILDEPTAFLDLANKYEIFYLLNKLSKQKNKTIIFSTHDLNIAINESDKIWLINDKQIIEGIPEDLALDSTFDKLFETSNITFEKESGEFYRARENDKTIGLEGEGVEFFWTKKALIRNNFQVDCNKKQELFVIIENKSELNWILNYKNHKFVCSSLNELINQLKNITYE